MLESLWVKVFVPFLSSYVFFQFISGSIQISQFYERFLNFAKYIIIYKSQDFQESHFL